jgi:hypothetical protein
MLQGCFLYAKLILDLLESGQLVVKAGSYKVIPRTLAEIYQLILNLRLVFSLFHSTRYTSLSLTSGQFSAYSNHQIYQLILNLRIVFSLLHTTRYTSLSLTSG